ncbi:MAG: hypothetical protein IT452_18730 [Planctomycetia bacterium]|nr:hypothetical protein [Planctomycetia bacterium]
MAAAEFTVGALLALATNLQGSVEAGGRLDFERAAALAGHVVEATNAPPQLVEAARILRARANLRAGRKTEAATDLEWVRVYGVSDGLRAEAAGELKRIDVAPVRSPRAARTPRREWSAIGILLARGDDEAALQRVQGPLRRIVDACRGLVPAVAGEVPRAGAGLAWIVNEWRNAKATETLEGDVGTLTLERNGLRMTLAARSAGDLWMFHDLVSIERLEDVPAPAAPDAAAAVAAAGPNAQIAIQIAGGNAMAFGGGGIAVINGQVIHLGGDVVGDVRIRVDSAQAAQAAALTNAPPPTEAQRGEIEALIKDLGSAQAATRAAARTRLRQMGPQAHGVLKEHRADADVEIATTVRELLGE